MALLVVAAAVVVAAAASTAFVLWKIDQETVAPLEVANQNGPTGRAFLVYQAGLTDFQERVTEAFTSGLRAAGWEVSTTTASAQAPLPDAKYDLLIFGSPVYMRAPAKPLTRYLSRVNDLRERPVVILMTAADDPSRAIATMERVVAEANGRPIRSLGFTTTTPNDKEGKYSGSNTDRALQLAREAGRTLSIRAR
jgi:hypothetical protein